MVATDAIEGTIDKDLWFHFDMDNDVLYLRKVESRTAATYADEQPDGTLLLRCLKTDAPVGLTVINWWKQFGSGKNSDSLRSLEEAIEPFARKLAA